MNFEFFKKEETKATKPYETYFQDTATSHDFLEAKKLIKTILDKYQGELNQKTENLAQLEAFLKEQKPKLTFPSATYEGVMSELIKSGFIEEYIEEKVTVLKEPDHIERNYLNKEKPNLTEAELEILDTNLIFEELEKSNVFKNEEELEKVFNQAKSLEKNKIPESREYYNRFVEFGLLEGGEIELKKDLEDLEKIKEKINLDNIKNRNNTKLEKLKKVSTVVEKGLAYAITELHWYGDSIFALNTSEFDDIKRGVDEVLEIHRKDEENSFLALGIDITYRGIESEIFKKKFFKLLDNIKNGGKTKIKYFTDAEGKIRKEFAIPKMVLSFDMRDVKEIISIVQNPNSGKTFDKQKIAVLSQILHSCKYLADFAKENQNNIFRKYTAIINSIEELSWENEEVLKIKEAVVQTNDPVSNKIKKLIQEYKDIKQAS